MSADDDVYLSLGEVFEHLGRLFGRLGTSEIIHPHRHILQTTGESAIMLIGEHCGRHEHCHLFTIAGRLEGRTHSHLSLSEAHIATDQTVHRLCHLHISLHILSGLQLIRGILIEETGLELVLQIPVGTKSKTLLTTTLGIELDEVSGDILDMFLGAFLEFLPLACTKGGETRRLAIILRLVFRHLIKRMDRYVDTVALLVENLYHLLVSLFPRSIGDRHTDETTELTYAMIDMHHEIANLKLLDLFESKGHLSTAGLVALEVVFVETVENLVVGEDTDFEVVVGETVVEGFADGNKAK